MKEGRKMCVSFKVKTENVFTLKQMFVNVKQYTTNYMYVNMTLSKDLEGLQNLGGFHVILPIIPFQVVASIRKYKLSLFMNCISSLTYI